MATVEQWIQDFSVTDEDIEYLNTLLLERETPMNTRTLARTLVERQLEAEEQRLAERFADALLYDPANEYEVGQRVVFSAYDYAIAEIVDIREGESAEYGAFKVIAVAFDNDSLNSGDSPREFASGLQQPHALNAGEDGDTTNGGMPTSEVLDVEEIIASNEFDDVLYAVDEAMQIDDSLLNVAGAWFPEDLMAEANEGHMHLAEAILDMYAGGPLTTQEIVENIGGIGENIPMELQVFSMNYAMNADRRFDEVGPAGEVLWFLHRMEPEHVQNTPEMLFYMPITYNRDTMPQNALTLERELADEHSPIPAASRDIESARVNIIYPHRRMGTLPLNYQAERIFPTARKTDRVAVTLIDAEDDEEYPVWIVRKAKYVYGLAPLYTKHAVPIGAYVNLRRSSEPGKIIIEFDSYRPRSEWVTIVTAQNKQIGFETSKRAIGIGFDDLLLLGVDDLQGVDALFQADINRQQPVATILRMLIPLLGGINTQGHVHARTLYSAVNVIRRCPPGPILTTLANNPDFENVGEHYWKLS